MSLKILPLLCRTLLTGNNYSSCKARFPTLGATELNRRKGIFWKLLVRNDATHVYLAPQKTQCSCAASHHSGHTAKGPLCLSQGRHRWTALYAGIETERSWSIPCHCCMSRFYTCKTHRQSLHPSSISDNKKLDHNLQSCTVNRLYKKKKRMCTMDTNLSLATFH